MASSLGSGAGWPGTVSASRSASPSSSSTRRRNATSSSGRATGSAPSSAGSLYGLAGIALAVGFATFRYHRIRFPDAWSYPGALLNTTATAFIDEVAFRGALLGLLLVAGVNPTMANFTQALVYTLTTRLAAPGRDRYLLLLTMGIGLVGGWLTVATGGIAAAFLGHAITRFAFFLCTGHTGQTQPRAREPEEIEKRRRPPEGWRIIGSRESASRDR